jgi:diguanylate cyclase (GGDEF)-like protein
MLWNSQVYDACNMTDLKNELLRILQQRLLSPVFQPVISVNQKQIIGYESLIRGPSDSPLHSPFNLFETANRHGLQAELECVCRQTTIQRFAQMNVPGKLFINVSPSVLLESSFKSGDAMRLIERSGLDPRNIIIELTEHEPTDDYQIMREAVAHYRNMGFEIALDDLGAGYSGLRLWSELHPEYVKIDKHFVQGLHADAVKLNFVRSIQNMATAMHCRVIAEGIETLEELQAIVKIGITFAQGYYFARPMAQPPLMLDSQLFVDSHYEEARQGSHNSKSVAELARIITPVTADTRVGKVLELFQHQNDLSIQPIVDDGMVSGLIFRDKFLSKLFSSRYGIELHGRQSIKTFISSTPFCVDKQTAIEQVSKQLTSAMRNDQAFVITEEGMYYGVATVLDLLEEITHLQIRNAMHANPLTLLPGNVPINEWINRLLANRQPFCVGYFDLDYFKPYNDVYGYSAGDSIIKAVADTLSRHITAETGHVGHIGGDDFIVVFISEDWFERCQIILQDFKAKVPEFYKAEDLITGGLYSEDRHGHQQFFPLLSLSVGLVDAQSTQQCQSHLDIADLASEAKKQAKKCAGNSFFINRRLTDNVETSRLGAILPKLRESARPNQPATDAVKVFADV